MASLSHLKSLPCRVSLILASLWLVACTETPEPLGHGDPVTLDTERPSVDLPDGGELPDPPSDTSATDTQAGSDTTTPIDSTVPQQDTAGPDLEGPEVVSAFSSDGLTVTVRFSEEVSVETAGDASEYTIQGSDNSTIDIGSATVNGRFVALELTNFQDINPGLTYTCYVGSGVTDLAGNGLDATKAKSVIRRTVYLNIIWHQHQPLYFDPARDQLTSPWVRKHATKDYYDMAAILKDYPAVHLNINLTSVLLNQLQLYLDRVLPFVDKANNTVDEAALLALWGGKTDPFIDLLLEDTPTPEEATEAQIGLLYDDPWATVSTAEATMVRWPEYLEIRMKNPKQLTQEDFLRLKIFFELAWFDPDFLAGPVALPTGAVVDLSDLVTAHPDGTFTLAQPASEEMANRLVAENIKVIEAVVPIHRELLYNWQTREGQIEITMTPFYHPILPLIADTDLAKIGQPYDAMPSPGFSYMDDAEAQVLKAVASYQSIFGIAPQGVWCGEGSVAEEIVQILRSAGLRWTATDQQVLASSQPSGGKPWHAYRVDGDTVAGDGGDTTDEMLIVFRDTQMSNDIGFKYQGYWGQDAADEIVSNVLAQAPPFGAPDRMITLIVDGENAWEEYKNEHDGKGFHHALYSSLSESFEVGEIVSVTVSEYIDGNPARSVPPHPIHNHSELEPLWPGSWIDGTYSIWIGEGEENAAWDYLRQAREDLAKSQLPRPNPLAPAPADSESYGGLVWAAWEEIYAAEGSDWFWWYGLDMTTPANDDTPFDQGFRAHLTGMYEFMNAALALQGKPTFPIPDFAPLVQAQPQPPASPFSGGLAPELDGQLIPNESEWTDEGGFFFDNDSGAQANQDDDISVVYYGYTDLHLYVGILANDDLSAKAGQDYALSLYFTHKHVVNIETGETESDPANPETRFGTPLPFSTTGAARELRIGFQGMVPDVKLYEADGSGAWSAELHMIELSPVVSQGKLVELRIPWDDLNMQLLDPLEMMVVASRDGADIDLAPALVSKVVFDDPTNAVYVTFQVDATGNAVAWDTYSVINVPPPPAGNGIVYITGNQDKLQQWTPNKVAMLDDGLPPDEVAGDGIWSLAVPFAPGTILRYKYTIGLPINEGNWYGTEEFPLTERGLEVTKDPSVKQVLMQDVFADRPQPTGTAGKLSVMTLLSE